MGWVRGGRLLAGRPEAAQRDGGADGGAAADGGGADDDGRDGAPGASAGAAMMPARGAILGGVGEMLAVSMAERSLVRLGLPGSSLL